MKEKLIKTGALKSILIILVLIAGPGMKCANENPLPNPPEKNKKIKLAILLDTSNSMDGLIDQAKSQLWNIVNELSKAECDGLKPELEIALYEYGNDNLTAKEGYIRLVTPLTGDLDQVSDDLFKLTTKGGSEFCGYVIHTSLNQLDWNEDGSDLQIIFIAGNEPFTQGNVSYVEACKRAKKNDIIVNTIFCGDFDEGVNSSWKSGAELTGGKYMSIEHNRKTVYIDTPYDLKITELNSKLNKTYIPYGTQGYSRQSNQLLQDNNALKYGAANNVNRVVTKSSYLYNNASWDLVDASEKKGFSLTNMKKSDLPENMQTMTSEERLKYLEENKLKRAAIQKEILELNEKREVYIAEKQNEEDSDHMLDNVMINAIKKQANDKNFLFK